MSWSADHREPLDCSTPAPFACYTQPVLPPPDTADVIEALFDRAEHRLRASRGRLRRAADDDENLAVRVGCSVAGLLDDRASELLAAQREYRMWFCDEWLHLLGAGFDQIDLLLAAGHHLNARVADELSPGVQRPRLFAIGQLHAHSILVASEICELLRAGWPAGAEARWRTLHEIEVVALFLVRSPATVSQRYLDSYATDVHRDLGRGVKRWPSTPEAADLEEQLRDRALAAIRRHGPEMAKPYGWAARWLRKKKVTFRDLETRVAPRRPAYVSASELIHAGRPGTIHSILDSADHLMIGRRSDGLADTALKTIWSANSTAGALLEVADALSDDNAFVIWDEAQTEIASEADQQIRRGEMTRLIREGRAAEAESYLASPEASLLRMARDVRAPRRSTSG